MQGAGHLEGWGSPDLSAERQWQEGAYLELEAAKSSLPAPAALLSPACPHGAGHQCCPWRRVRGTSVLSPSTEPPATAVLFAGL